MKSLADLKRRLQVGVRLELTYCSFAHKHVGFIRRVVSRNSRGVGMKTPFGEASFLDVFSSGDHTIEFPKGKLNSFRLIDACGGVLEYRIYD